MFYSEKYKSPISLYHVKRLFGVDPANDAAGAAKIGVYPLTYDAGTNPVERYIRTTTGYNAVRSNISLAQIAALEKLTAAGGDITSVVANHIADWSSSITYATNDIVEHEGGVWKALRASTNVEPADPDLDADPNGIGINLDWDRLY